MIKESVSSLGISLPVYSLSFVLTVIRSPGPILKKRLFKFTYLFFLDAFFSASLFFKSFLIPIAAPISAAVPTIAAPILNLLLAAFFADDAFVTFETFFAFEDFFIIFTSYCKIIFNQYIDLSVINSSAVD